MLETETKQQQPISKKIIFVSIIMAFFSAFCSLSFIQKFFLNTPAYPDFIVGAITWGAATKFQDLVSYPVFVLGFVAGGWCAYRMLQKTLDNCTYGYVQSLITSLIWWLVPLAIGIGGFLSIYPNDTSFLIYIGIAGAVLTLFAVRLNSHSNYGVAMPQQIGIGVLAVMLIGLLPLGFASIQDRLPVFSEALRFRTALSVGGLFVIFATIYLFYMCRISSNPILRNVSKLLLVAQLGIAPFYLLILPDLYVTESAVPAVHTTVWLWVLVLGLVLAAIVDVVIRYKKVVANHITDLSQMLSPVAIFGTIILMRCGATVIPHVSSDDYHFGESLLGWWSYSVFGKIAYIDYVQPHGIFADDIGGFISLIFFDGTAATLAEADRLAATLTMFISFMALRLYTGSLGLAYVSILLFGTIARKLFFLILVPFFCLWLKTANWKPYTWLWLWLITAIVLVLLVPSQGLLAVIASFPVVALYLYRARQSNWKWHIIVLGIVVGAFAFFTPIPIMFFSAIRYVLENGPINQIAYGIPWSSSKGEADVIKLEILRMSWVWVPLLAIILILALFNKREQRYYLIGVALPILLFASLMTPYTMGRIDPAAMSRPGIFTNFAWAVLLPILLAPLLALRGRAVLAASIAFVCAGIGLANVNKEGIHSVLEKNQVGGLWVGAEHGLKNMGTGRVDPQHVDRLVRINSFLSSHLAHQETYLDLTGRNAQYMYFDRPPAMSTTAPYNLAPIKQQQRIVEQLDKSLPRMALIEADNINHDGGGMALRSHILYRFVLKNYHAELHDGYVYGFTKVDDARHSSIDFTLRQLTDLNWEKGVHRSENALIIRDTLSLRYLQVGDELVLPDATSRKITKIWPEGNAIWFDGLRFEPNVADSLREIQVVLNDQRRQQLSAQLMEHVFAVADLRKIPLAWGQSASSLGNVMKPIVDLNFAHAGSHDLKAENNSYRIVGIDPYLWLDLTPKNITGQSAGLLKFDLACEGGANPQMQVFWWGDDRVGADELHSLHFNAANGTVIVPLDAYPNWLEMKNVKGLRIDLETAGACKTLSIQHASLNQRTNF